MTDQVNVQEIIDSLTQSTESSIPTPPHTIPQPSRNQQSIVVEGFTNDILDTLVKSGDIGALIPFSDSDTNLGDINGTILTFDQISNLTEKYDVRVSSLYNLTFEGLAYAKVEDLGSLNVGDGKVIEEGEENELFSTKGKVIKVYSWNGNMQQEAISTANSYLLPFVKHKNIKLEYPHGSRKAVTKTSKFFRLLFYCGASHLGYTYADSAPQYLFGNKVLRRTEPFTLMRHRLSGEGLKRVDKLINDGNMREIKCQSTGFVVATLFYDHMLMIHYDIFHNPSDWDAVKIFEEICLQTAIMLTPKAKKKDLEDFISKRSEELFGEHIENVIKNNLKRNDRDILSYKKAIEDQRKKLTEHYSKMEALIQTTQWMRKGRDEFLGKIKSDIETIRGLDKIESIEFNQGGFIIGTSNLLCMDQVTQLIHSIGVFKIQINFSRPQGVRWYNQTRKINSYDSAMNAPHVYKDGNACLGTASTQFEETLGRLDVLGSVVLAIAFVETANPADSAGSGIVKWPLATKKELIAAGYKGDENVKKKQKK